MRIITIDYSYNIHFQNNNHNFGNYNKYNDRGNIYTTINRNNHD